MSETYVPRPGDRVRFYSWAAQMDLFGEVLSVAPQARMATVREDNEEGHTCVKSWDVLRLDEAAPSPDEWREIVAATVERAEKAEAALVQQIDATNAHFLRVRELDKRLSDMEADRDGWVQEANDNQYIARMGYEERDKERARVKELEDQLAKLQAQNDAAPYATGYPVGDKVAARIAEYRERTHAAEDERDEYRKDWQAAESRVEDLEDQNRALKSDLDHARAAGEALRRVVERHRAETWTDHDGTVRNLGGITRAELAQKLYDENERAGREKARADKAEAELASLKAALKTLSN